MTKQEAVDYLEKLPIDTRIGNTNQPMSSDLINMSMEALEKQIPKELVNNIEYPSCPSCNRAFYWGCIDKYCNACGQALKWE